MKAVVTLKYFITHVKFCVTKHTQNVSMNFHVYLHAKNKLHQYFFLKYCKKYYQLPILGTLDMSGYSIKNDNANL